MWDYLLTAEFIRPLLIAAAGEFTLNMMNLIEDASKTPAQRTSKGALYWVIFTFRPLAGAGLAYLYLDAGYDIGGLPAFTTGLTAPTTLQTLMKSTASRSGSPQGVIEETTEPLAEQAAPVA